MPRVHVETAITQFTGTRTMLATQLERALAEEPALRREVEPARDRAVDALDAHLEWLGDALDSAFRDPRLGEAAFARKLSLTLDAAQDADAVLARAEGDLLRLEELIAETASRLDSGSVDGRVRRVLDRLAQDGTVDDETVVALCEQAMAETTAFLRTRDLVTVHDDPVEIIVMPEIHRGVAVAYCDPPGPLEYTPLRRTSPSHPPRRGWSQARVHSFYREYNAHMLHNLTVHEAMPGHVLQLAHAAGTQGTTTCGRAFRSGAVRRGLGGLRRGAHGRPGYRAEEGARRGAADAAAEDAAPDDHQRHPRRPASTPAG